MINRARWNMMKIWMSVAFGIALCISSVATADPANPLCAKEIEKKIRDRIAKDYQCDVQGIRCIDGHVGRAFTSEKYIDGDRLYELGVPGAPIHLRVFALQQCAAERLAGIKFSSGTIKNQDTLNQKADKQTTNAADKVKEASDKVSKTQDEVRQQTDRAKQAKDAANAQLSASVKQPCGPGDKLCPKFDEIRKLFAGEITTEQLSLLQRSLDQLSPAEQQNEQIKKATDAFKVTKDADAAIKSKIHDLTRDLDDLNAKMPGLSGELTPKVDDLRKEAESSQWTQVRITLGDIQSKLTEAKTVIAEKPTLPEWPSVSLDVDGQARLVSVAEDSVAVPEGDDNKFLTVSVTNSVKDGDADRKLWPDTTLSVKVDRGLYHQEVGILFAGVYNGNREFTSAGHSCPDHCSLALQPMLVGTLFPWGRPNAKEKVSSARGLAPGIQGGINLDVTKASKAISVGLVIEPATGIAISGGVMLYARPIAPPESDGSQKTAEKVLPYFGVSFTSDLYNTIKSAISSSNDKGNASDKKSGKSE
jgi:hypothetical protein